MCQLATSLIVTDTVSIPSTNVRRDILIMWMWKKNVILFQKRKSAIWETLETIKIGFTTVQDIIKVFKDGGEPSSSRKKWSQKKKS